MLCLKRKNGQAIVIGSGSAAVRIVVDQAAGGQCQLAIEAPRDVPVCRGELLVNRPGPDPDTNTATEIPAEAA